jgi:ribosomal protein S18 acetylase RimI-like enzyme
LQKVQIQDLTPRTVRPQDQSAAISTIVLAFATDPMARWSWPNTADYLRLMPALTRAFGGAAFAHGSAFCTDNHEGVALWLPPGASPDEEAMVGLVEESLDEERRQEMFAVFEQMAQFHPTEPHWYLPLIGVDPVHQGKGVGSALLRHVTDRFDREGAVAYLESSNPRNITLYERHGFRQVGRIQAGSSPVMVAMVRGVRS